MHAERYQIALIISALAVAAFLSVFFYREMFPEYRIYQNDYIALEQFRSTYTGEPPPVFHEGVKQIVFEREDKGPAVIDRCTSCHVALQLPHFSPTKIAHDINGNIIRDASGTPVQEPNEEFIWAKLDNKIAALLDGKVNEQLTAENESAQVSARLKEAAALQSLKTATVGEHTYDVTKVLAMHPLIGKETRPFEFHPPDEYGCTICHSGNGKGLTTAKAHGPVFSDQYEAEYMGPRPEFLEHDPANDPQFAQIFNDKPADSLLFQTSPILVGGLIQAKCVQCHKQSTVALQGLADTAGNLAGKKKKYTDLIQQGYQQEVSAALSLFRLQALIQSRGLEQTIIDLTETLSNLGISPKEEEQIKSQLNFLKKTKEKNRNTQPQEHVLTAIQQRLNTILGAQNFVSALSKKLSEAKIDQAGIVEGFLKEHRQSPDATGSLFIKWEALNLEQALLRHVQDTQSSFAKAISDETAISLMTGDIDALTKHYQRGQELYISQGCYACHRIAGFSRGGVGPELTRAAGLYPWYMKEKITWPQGTLKTSTMPNMRLDHIEVEDLMTFLLGQNGPTKAVSQTDYKIAIQEWEAGRKQPWEQPISPEQMHDLRYAMTVFATQGCAACHRLKGFESNVGYRIEQADKDKPNFDALYQEHAWFQNLFPEAITGSEIVTAIEQHSKEIDARIIDNVRKGSLLEELEEKHPESIESLYSPFRYAARAKNHQYAQAAKAAATPQDKQIAQDQLKAWKERVHRIMMMYVQEYGLGRLVGPKPNWSGIYRSDAWLMEHFRNPTGHVPNSIMPIFPFDDTKFYALTSMLDILGKRNRDETKAIWEHKGFDPALAFEIHCAQCHGEYLQGNGPVSTWIYPIPKDLRNAEFLRNLTKEETFHSIMHGIKGTPMPPWGETPKDKLHYDGIPVLNEEQIHLLVNWLYAPLPGATVIKTSEDVPKWQYSLKDVTDELQREGSKLAGNKEKSIFEELPNPQKADSKNMYYIKKALYTQKNLEQGKVFFENNCAVCHGKDADGAGARATIMNSAKPRMLINLDWLNSRDDLRLLRSIKYGVAGTSMTPWGDATTSLQRLQLVMYIRSLSRENAARAQLIESLYNAYTKAYQDIESTRTDEYELLAKTQKQLEEAKKQARAIKDLPSSPETTNEAVENYKQQLAASTVLKEYEANDQQFADLKSLVKQEEDILRQMGIDLLRAEIDTGDWERFISIIDLNSGRIAVKDNVLIWSDSAERAAKIDSLIKQIIASYDANIALEKEKAATPNQASSDASTMASKEIDAKINTYTKVKRTILSGFNEIDLLQKHEKRLIALIAERQQTGKKGHP